MIRDIAADLTWSYGFSKCPFDQAILKRVKTDRYQSSSRAQLLNCRFQPEGQITHFIIDTNSDCLEASCSRVLLFMFTYRRLDKFRQLSGCFQTLLLPSLHDTPGNPARMALLSKLPKNAGHFPLRCLCQPNGRRYTLCWVHPHIQGPVLSKRKATLRIVQLW